MSYIREVMKFHTALSSERAFPCKTRDVALQTRGNTMALESSAGREGYSRVEPSSAPSPTAPPLLGRTEGLRAAPPEPMHGEVMVAVPAGC